MLDEDDEGIGFGEDLDFEGEGDVALEFVEDLLDREDVGVSTEEEEARGDFFDSKLLGPPGEVEVLISSTVL